MQTSLSEVKDNITPIDKNDETVHFWDGDELVKAEFPPHPQIVEGLIERGNLVILAGPPKAGKSWFTLDLARSVSMGSQLLAEHNCEQGDTLLLALEDTARRVSNRLKKINDAEKDPASMGRMHILTQAPRMDDGGMKYLRAWVEKVEKPSLIIIDTLIRFRPWDTIGGGYTNDSLALIPLHKFAQDHGLTIVVVHHDIKAANASWENTISGAKGLTGIADGMMLLKKPSAKQSYGKLYVTGRDIEDATYNVLFDKKHCRWYKCEDQEIEEDEIGGDGIYIPTPLEQKILVFMRGLPESTVVGTKDIEIGTGLSPNSIKPSLTVLNREGLIERIQRGQYVYQVQEQDLD